MTRIDDARAFATIKHKGQLRKSAEGAVPYILHPQEVAQLVQGRGCDDIAIAAAWLHDVIEDCGCTHGELVGLFGREVAAVVLELTDDPRLSKTERKRAQIEHVLSHRARCVKIADKTSNVRSLPTSGWERSAILGYTNHATAVVEMQRGLGFGKEDDDRIRALGREFDIAAGTVLDWLEKTT
jgi:guanosine-3',5'-bis(diphosphate) 3'-pyrophosphohydrolase